MNSKCFSFYSYKGGSGRTTTLLNVTKHLAELYGATPERPVLIVDADLESAGLTYFFECKDKFTSRLKFTVHSDSFLNYPKELLTGVIGDNTFGESRENLEDCTELAKRIDALLPGYNILEHLRGLRLRTTLKAILSRIVDANESCRQAELQKTSAEAADVYFASTYRLEDLISKILLCRDDSEKKIAAVEEFLPADGMVDVSSFFGLEKGCIRFIGVDVSATGERSTVSNETALKNKTCIARECGKHGFSAVLFDCGAGVQSTAHVLNHISDVIVYCSRPTYQFVAGTSMQLLNYQSCLDRIVQIKKEKADGAECDKKSVILLPTAVPFATEETESLQENSFEKIRRIAGLWKSFVDDTFCSYEKSLKEVSLFKWREHILGVDVSKYTDKLSENEISILSRYMSYSDMPEDAKSAYDTYRLVAERLVYNA